MGPVTLVQVALAAGTGAGIKDTTSLAIKDAYEGLKARVKGRFAPAAKARQSTCGIPARLVASAGTSRRSSIRAASRCGSATYCPPQATAVSNDEITCQSSCRVIVITAVRVRGLVGPLRYASVRKQSAAA